MNFKFISLLFILLSIFLSSCNDNEGNKIIYIGDPNFVSVASKDNGEVMFIIYQRAERASLNVGYNDLYLYFRDMKKELSVENIDYSVELVLDNDNLESAIFPESESNSLRLFKIPTYFIQPSTNQNKWIFRVSYKYKGKQYNEEVLLEVGDNPLYSSFQIENKTYYINQIEPKIQRIGVMDFDFVILEKDENGFRYFDDFKCDIKVYNSKRETSNNAAPVNQENGFYKGSIYVPEIGAWQVESNFKFNNEIVFKYIYPIFIKTEE